jgi:hypothetical protein
MLCITAVLGEFGKLRKAYISCGMSVIPHGLNTALNKKNYEI